MVQKIEKLGDYLYLYLSDFSSGYIIYLEVHFYSIYEDDPLLYYKETNDIGESYLKSLNFSTKNSYHNS